MNELFRECKIISRSLRESCFCGRGGQNALVMVQSHLPPVVAEVNGTIVRTPKSTMVSKQTALAVRKFIVVSVCV